MKIRMFFYFQKADALFENPQSELVINEEIQFHQAAVAAIESIWQCIDEAGLETNNVYAVVINEKWTYIVRNLNRNKGHNDVIGRIHELLVEKCEEENL